MEKMLELVSAMKNRGLDGAADANHENVRIFTSIIHSH